ncbi:hypothetical protein K458DRAFT_396975 [Lentithecium fluviatile CBS 122367]|uniref:Uncharacterized protein n=1 Tax=Lentithecium fluviatile CBS 122367 TaxID=1168545 RepID=A0A6G1IDW2_9PLEO|nr:hypothetical protein K458DRAFT_396975 [Lentithecium fluviatile CBS 122367]
MAKYISDELCTECKRREPLCGNELSSEPEPASSNLYEVESSESSVYTSESESESEMDSTSSESESDPEVDSDSESGPEPGPYSDTESDFWSRTSAQHSYGSPEVTGLRSCCSLQGWGYIGGYGNTTSE